MRRALNHPKARQDDEALHVVAPLDDLYAQDRHLGDGSINLPGVLAAISPDQFEPGEASAYLVEDQPAPAAILDRGGADDDPHREPFCVDRGVDLAPLHLLAGLREPQPGGCPGVPSARARPCAARPRSPPIPPRAGTCGRCCRPLSVAESRHAAGSAKGSRCAASKEWRSLSPACRSCGCPPGVTPRISHIAVRHHGESRYRESRRRARRNKLLGQGLKSWARYAVAKASRNPISSDPDK